MMTPPTTWLVLEPSNTEPTITGQFVRNVLYTNSGLLLPDVAPRHLSPELPQESQTRRTRPQLPEESKHVNIPVK